MDQLFDLRGLSAYSTIPVSGLRYHIRENGLPCFKLTGQKGKAGKILVKRTEFEQWLENFRFNRNQHIDGIVNDVLKSLKKA